MKVYKIRKKGTNLYLHKSYKHHWNKTGTTWNIFNHPKTVIKYIEENIMGKFDYNGPKPSDCEIVEFKLVKTKIYLDP